MSPPVGAPAPAPHPTGPPAADWRALLGAMAEGVALLEVMPDPDGRPVDYRIVGLNAAFDLIFGTEPGAARTLPAGRLFGMEPPPHLADIAGLVPNREGPSFEVSLPGTDRTILVTAFAVDDRLRAAVFTETTERRRLEQRLGQAQRMEALGQLAGGVAHDFNNLLTAILGYTELLLSALEPDDPRRLDTEEIRRAGETATVLNRQLLAFSRRELMPAGPLDVNEIVREVEKMLGRLLGSHIVITLDLAPALRAVKVEPGHIQQLLLNLALNARDAMARGGILTIATRDVELGPAAARRLNVQPGCFVALSVRDTGPGIDAAIRPHIFEPFFTTKEGGTGLGLATVRGIVTQAGGAIDTSSEPGAGASFDVYLPATNEPADHGSRSGPRSVPGGSETILLVEDDARVRELARKVLEQNGYTVLEARDSDSAIRLAHEFRGRIDLVVADVVLPGADGREVARRLQSDRASLRTLYMSGLECAPAAGARRNAVLQKPFTPQDLLLRVRQALAAPAGGKAGRE